MLDDLNLPVGLRNRANSDSPHAPIRKANFSNKRHFPSQSPLSFLELLLSPDHISLPLCLLAHHITFSRVVSNTHLYTYFKLLNVPTFPLALLLPPLPTLMLFVLSPLGLTILTVLYNNYEWAWNATHTHTASRDTYAEPALSCRHMQHLSLQVKKNKTLWNIQVWQRIVTLLTLNTPSCDMLTLQHTCCCKHSQKTTRKTETPWAQMIYLAVSSSFASG